MIIRQGDVLMIHVSDTDIPEDSKVQPLTLAIGEESGHSHVLHGAVERWVDARRYVDVPRDTRCDIQPPGMGWRHLPVQIARGTYEIIVEREYVPGAVPRTMED